MTKKRTLSFGERVKLSLFCPIDSEGIGPIPGDQGYIVSHAASTDARSRELRVFFAARTVAQEAGSNAIPAGHFRCVTRRTSKERG
jgi:hypothetical protein